MNRAPVSAGRATVRVPSALLKILPALLLLVPVWAQDASIDVEAEYARGNALYDDAEFQDAILAYDAAIGTGVGELAAQARMGKIRAALRVAEFGLALEEARTLEWTASTDPEARALLGDALWANGYFDEAEEVYAFARGLAPEATRARFGHARALATRGQLDAALDEAVAVADRAPDDAEVQALIGQIHERQGRYEDAISAYERYLSLIPNRNPTTTGVLYRARVRFLRSFRGREPLQLDPESVGRTHRLPFRMVDKKIVVEGRINGEDVDFVLDTGSERTGISRETAREVDVSPVAATVSAGAGAGPGTMHLLELGRADVLEFGSLRIHNVPVSIRSMAADTLPAWQAQSFSPLALGLSMVVDYARQEVVIAEEVPDSPADIRLPMRINRLPMVRGLINSTHPAYFVVDTGGEVISISADTAESLAMPPPARHIPLRVFGRSGVDEDAFLLPGVDLDFDQIAYRGVGLAVLNLRGPSVLLGFRVGGIVGHRFLSGYRVTMDLMRGELRLERQL